MSDGGLASGDCTLEGFSPNPPTPPHTLDSVALAAASHRQKLHAARHAFLCSSVEPTFSTFHPPRPSELVTTVNSDSDASCSNLFCTSPVITNSSVISSSVGFDKHHREFFNIRDNVNAFSVLQPLTVDCSTYSEHHFPSSFPPCHNVPHGYGYPSVYQLSAKDFSHSRADIIRLPTSTSTQSSAHSPFSCLFSDESCSKGVFSPVTKCVTLSPQSEYANDCAARNLTPCTLSRVLLHTKNKKQSRLVRLQPVYTNGTPPDKTSLISANWSSRSHMSSSDNQNQYLQVSTSVLPTSIPLAVSHSTVPTSCAAFVHSVMKNRTPDSVPCSETRSRERVTRSSEIPVSTTSYRASPYSYHHDPRPSAPSSITSPIGAECFRSSQNSLLQKAASDLKTRKNHLNDNLSKMESTIRNFTSHLSHIDSTLGRMKEFGSVSQYLNCVTDEDIQCRTQSSSSSSESQHTHSGFSNSPDSANPFAYRSNAVDVVSPQEGSKHLLPTYSSLGASLTTLSSSVWSSLCPSDCYPPFSSSVQRRNQLSLSPPPPSPLSGQPDRSHYSNERILKAHELESSDTELSTTNTPSKTHSAGKYDSRVSSRQLPHLGSSNQPPFFKNAECSLTDHCSCSSASLTSKYAGSQHGKGSDLSSARQFPDEHRIRSRRHRHGSRFYGNHQHHLSSPELHTLPICKCGRCRSTILCQHARTSSTDKTPRCVETLDDSNSYSSSSATSERISSSVGMLWDAHELFERLSHLLLASREEEARGLIKQLFSTPRSRAKLKALINHLIDVTQSRSTEVDTHDRDPSRGYQSASPTGSLLRLAKSLLYVTNGRAYTDSNPSSSDAQGRPRTPELNSAPSNLSLGESSNFYPSLYQSITPKHRSAGSMTSSHSVQFIKWPSNMQVEEHIPAMRVRPRPAPPSHPRSTILPTPEVLNRLDTKAVETLASNFVSFTELVRTLTSDLTSSVHIVRVLFSWTVANNLLYKEFDQAAPPESLIGMLRQVKNGQITRCELLLKLCRFAGVHCYFITGYSKGVGYRPGMPLKSNRLFHSAWLAVHVSDQWMFVNPDWALPVPKQTFANSDGTGSSLQYSRSALDRSERFCDEFYFLTDPDQHIFQHFPDQKIWQLLHKPISLECFTHLPLLRSPFFNAKLSLKRNYGDCLVTSNGQVTIKLLMPQFVGVSCLLENCADHSILHGLCLVEVLNRMDVVRVQAAPSQPGKYYLNLFISLDWRREYDRELACSFQIHCSEHNYSRLIEMGRLPEVGFLGPTPASRTLGIFMCPIDASGRSFIVHKSSGPLRLYFVVAPGLKVCHQLKSFDRPGHQMVDCDSYALLQMRSIKPGASRSSSKPNGYYQIRMPVEGFYYLTVYASANTEVDTDHLECVYRVLIDARRAPPASNVAPFPHQTYWWVYCRLYKPLSQRLFVNRTYSFHLDAPLCDSVAVVINEKDWHFLRNSDGTSKWIGDVNVGDYLGQLSVFGRFWKSVDEFRLPHSTEEDSDAFVKLLDYVIVE